jgi:hypothetical protein
VASIGMGNSAFQGAPYREFTESHPIGVTGMACRFRLLDWNAGDDYNH